jgi:hypothetical protein
MIIERRRAAATGRTFQAGLPLINNSSSQLTTIIIKPNLALDM